MRKPRVCCARSLCTGREEGRVRGCHNEGKPRTRQARRRAARHLPLPDRPGTSPSAPVSFDKAKSFRGNGARTRLHRRARDSSLLVAWMAPAGVLGNEAILVASEAQLSARFSGLTDRWLRTDGPEVVGEVAIRDVIVGHREVALLTPARSPGIAHEHPFGGIVVTHGTYRVTA